MDNELHTDDHVEIVLNTLEGLRDFFAYVDHQHEEFLKDVSTLGDQPAFAVAIQSGTTAYTRLTRHIEAAESQLESGGVPGDETIALIQQDYDEFMRVYEVLSAHTEPAEAGVTLSGEHGEVSIPTELYASHQKLERQHDQATALDAQYQAAAGSLGSLAETAALTHAQLVTVQKQIAHLEGELIDGSVSAEGASVAAVDERIDAIENHLTQIERSFKSLLPQTDLKDKGKKIFSELTPAKEIGKDSIVSSSVLKDKKYQEVIDERFSSPAAFEAALWRLISRIEEPQKLDKVLGVKHGSIFKEVLRGQTVGEVDFFNQQPGERIREVLQVMENEDKVVYDYRIYVEWMEEFSYMQQVVQYDPDMLFEEMFVRSELEPYL